MSASNRSEWRRGKALEFKTRDGGSPPASDFSFSFIRRRGKSYAAAKSQTRRLGLKKTKLVRGVGVLSIHLKKNQVSSPRRVQLYICTRRRRRRFSLYNSDIGGSQSVYLT